MADPTNNDPNMEQEDDADDGRSILMGLVAQLKPGMDLSRITLPTFVLEPRSMLERISDFMSHPEIVVE